MTDAHANPADAHPRPGAGQKARRRSDSVDLPLDRLSLTDFLDLDTLRSVQDAFAAVTKLETEIVDALGEPLVKSTNADDKFAADAALGQLITADAQLEDGKFVAPIEIEGRTLGSIVVRADDLSQTTSLNTQRLDALADALDLPDQDRDNLIHTAESAFAANRAAAVQFLYLIANAIARLCYQTYQARHHLHELSALYRVSTVLSGTTDPQRVLGTAAREVAEVLAVDAVVIRLLENDPNSSDGPELKRAANHGLSESYINQNHLLVNRSELFGKVLAGQTMYVADLATDPRTYFPALAKEEGLASMLAVGMIDQGTPIGSIQAYTTQPRTFSKEQVKLFRAVAQLTATAVSRRRLEADRQKNQNTLRQLNLAADVQRRMLPASTPDIPGLDVAAKYVPSYHLSGDFYDFVRLGEPGPTCNWGFAIGDVAGKGIAASLLMASVRASLRAYAHDLYHLSDVIRRVNVALCRDTLDAEFATLWYGVFDPAARRLTYCNAGHEPPLLLRDGQLQPLDEGGMVVGVDREQDYDSHVVSLQPGDLVLLYTDGLPDAMSPDQHRFGRERIDALFHEVLERGGPSKFGTAQDFLNLTLRKLREHTGPRRGSDDCTLVALRVT
ncbi:MAG: GAF domain-containing SpoIIE family protein phosphatase [Planctomycetota bacterium]